MPGADSVDINTTGSDKINQFIFPIRPLKQGLDHLELMIRNIFFNCQVLLIYLFYFHLLFFYVHFIFLEMLMTHLNLIS